MNILENKSFQSKIKLLSNHTRNLMIWKKKKKSKFNYEE